MHSLRPGDDRYESLVSQDDSPTIDITALWYAAGRPERCSPWAWAEREASHPNSGQILATGDERGDPVFLPRDVALKYARALACLFQALRLLEAWELIKADPAGCLISRPDPHLAYWVLPVVARARGVGIDEAAKMLIAEVVERTADLDPFEQESLVAKAQRAVRDAPSPIELVAEARAVLDR
jgi:hypothetical protein